MPGIFDDAELISGYSRAQAIEDGILVDLWQQPTAETPDLDDLKKIAVEAGIKFPIAMTATAFLEWIVPSDQDRKDGQSADGRLWDVYTLLRHAIRASRGPLDEVRFQVIVWKDGRQHTVALKALCGPGDNAEPVITIMLPDED